MISILQRRLYNSNILVGLAWFWGIVVMIYTVHESSSRYPLERGVLFSFFAFILLVLAISSFTGTATSLTIVLLLLLSITSMSSFPSFSNSVRIFQERLSGRFYYMGRWKTQQIGLLKYHRPPVYVHCILSSGHLKHLKKTSNKRRGSFTMALSCTSVRLYLAELRKISTSWLFNFFKMTCSNIRIKKPYMVFLLFPI